MFEKSARRLRAREVHCLRPTWRPCWAPLGRLVQIRLCESLAELEPYRAAWEVLAGGCAFRRWTWLSTWWRHYGSDGDATIDSEKRRGRRLFVLLALDDQSAAYARESSRLLGVLPCYVAKSLARGRVLRLLGDGEVCSDHLGLLAAPAHAEQVAQAMAEWLADDLRWDLVDFPAVDESDAATARLFDALGAADCGVAHYDDKPCWTIELPATWDDFLALQSKSHRKQLRQAERRVLDSNRAALHRVADASEFDAAWATLIHLHQRRRISLGEPGCFASPAWAAMHRDVARRLLDEGNLRLSWLELDGAPIAAEYHIAGERTTYAYQGGVDPTRLDEEPGRLSAIRAIQQAIAERHAQFDFLRGDEPYKPHWRAEPRPTCRWQATAPRALARLRWRGWVGARNVGRWTRQVSGLFG